MNFPIYFIGIGESTLGPGRGSIMGWTLTHTLVTDCITWPIQRSYTMVYLLNTYVYILIIDYSYRWYTMVFTH